MLRFFPNAYLRQIPGFESRPRTAIWTRLAPLSIKADPHTITHQQLVRLRELIQRVGSTNKLQEKRSIIAEYPDLRELLEQ